MGQPAYSTRSKIGLLSRVQVLDQAAPLILYPILLNSLFWKDILKLTISICRGHNIHIYYIQSNSHMVKISAIIFCCSDLLRCPAYSRWVQSQVKRIWVIVIFNKSNRPEQRQTQTFLSVVSRAVIASTVINKRTQSHNKASTDKSVGRCASNAKTTATQLPRRGTERFAHSTTALVARVG